MCTFNRRNMKLLWLPFIKYGTNGPVSVAVFFLFYFDRSVFKCTENAIGAVFFFKRTRGGSHFFQ